MRQPRLLFNVFGLCSLITARLSVLRVRAVFIATLVALAPGVVGAAEQKEGIAALGRNLPGLIAQLVNFAILLVVLLKMKYYWVERAINRLILLNFRTQMYFI